MQGGFFMKYLILCFLFILSINSALSQSRYTINQNPYINNPYYKHHNYYKNEILQRDLAALERYSMNRIYPKDNTINRINRLEQLAFGSIQNGDIETRYKNVESAILARPKSQIKRTTIGALTNYLKGQPTGITPPVYNNAWNNFVPNYDNIFFNNSNSIGNSRFDQFSNGFFSNGYNIMNNNLRNGSSIKILD